MGMLSRLVIEAHHNGDTNLTQREIDLEYGLKDKQESMHLFTQYFIHLFHKLYLM